MSYRNETSSFKHRGPSYGAANHELAPIAPVSNKSFKEAFKALQARRAAAGKLVLPSNFNPRLK